MFSHKSRQILLLTILFVVVVVILLFSPVYAWQVSVQYGHNNRFGGEAESGWHRGNIEFSGSERWIRAGDDYVFWTQQQVDWWIANGDNNNRPAMVYHAFKLNSNECGDIRVADKAWSWSNIPNWDIWTKRAGC